MWTVGTKVVEVGSVAYGVVTVLDVPPLPCDGTDVVVEVGTVRAT